MYLVRTVLPTARRYHPRVIFLGNQDSFFCFLAPCGLLHFHERRPVFVDADFSLVGVQAVRNPPLLRLIWQPVIYSLKKEKQLAQEEKHFSLVASLAEAPEPGL